MEEHHLIVSKNDLNDIIIKNLLYQPFDSTISDANPYINNRDFFMILNYIN